MDDFTVNEIMIEMVAEATQIAKDSNGVGYGQAEEEINGHHVRVEIIEAQTPKREKFAYRKSWFIDGKKAKAGSVCDCIAEYVA